MLTQLRASGDLNSERGSIPSPSAGRPRRPSSARNVRFVVQERHGRALQAVAQVRGEPRFTLGRPGAPLQGFTPLNRRANRRTAESPQPKARPQNTGAAVVPIIFV